MSLVELDAQPCREVAQSVLVASAHGAEPPHLAAAVDLGQHQGPFVGGGVERGGSDLVPAHLGGESDGPTSPKVWGPSMAASMVIRMRPSGRASRSRVMRCSHSPFTVSWTPPSGVLGVVEDEAFVGGDLFVALDGERDNVDVEREIVGLPVGVDLEAHEFLRQVDDLAAAHLHDRPSDGGQVKGAVCPVTGGGVDEIGQRQDREGSLPDLGHPAVAVAAGQDQDVGGAGPRFTSTRAPRPARSSRA